ncbi:unnamed protein product [Orchesella dallaii]|uniref:Uncharacterized protein n=1 Tax=Orchesella dallaii TaxID=48710 RepID=A0ABP1RBE9_9HEXA
MIIAFGTMGEVSRTSNETLYKIRRSLANVATCSQKDKLSRRILRSMPPVRMALGSVSFFDELFAAANIDFVIRQTVSLLLLGKQ